MYIFDIWIHTWLCVMWCFRRNRMPFVTTVWTVLFCFFVSRIAQLTVCHPYLKCKMCLYSLALIDHFKPCVYCVVHAVVATLFYQWLDYLYCIVSFYLLRRAISHYLLMFLSTVMWPVFYCVVCQCFICLCSLFCVRGKLCFNLLAIL